MSPYGLTSCSYSLRCSCYYRLNHSPVPVTIECGYWHLWRFNPALIEEGKNQFSLDSKDPNWANFHDFLLGEVRYLSVKKAYPNEAEELFAEAQRMAQLRYKTYVRKTQEDWSNE